MKSRLIFGLFCFLGSGGLFALDLSSCKQALSKVVRFVRYKQIPGLSSLSSERFETSQNGASAREMSFWVGKELSFEEALGFVAGKLPFGSVERDFVEYAFYALKDRGVSIVTQNKKVSKAKLFSRKRFFKRSLRGVHPSTVIAWSSQSLASEAEVKFALGLALELAARAQLFPLTLSTSLRLKRLRANEKLLLNYYSVFEQLPWHYASGVGVASVAVASSSGAVLAKAAGGGATLAGILGGAWLGVFYRAV